MRNEERGEIRNMKSEIRNGSVLLIDGSWYRARYQDPGILRPEDRGLWRCDKVKRDRNGFWYCCDDDDYLIDDDGRIVARETGWDLRRFEV